MPPPRVNLDRGVQDFVRELAQSRDRGERTLDFRNLSRDKQRIDNLAVSLRPHGSRVEVIGSGALGYGIRVTH